MNPKQKAQLKKGLVFSGLGLLCALSIWWIFAPSSQERAQGAKGLNKDLPEATLGQLPRNKLKTYELGDKSRSEELAEDEMGRLSDYLAEETAPPVGQATQPATPTPIEGSLQRYEENKRLLSSFYAHDPYEAERAALRAEIDELREALREQEEDAEDEEEKQLRLMERSYQMASKYLPKGTSLPSNAFIQASERELVEPQEGGSEIARGEIMLEALTEPKELVSSLPQPASDSLLGQGLTPKERQTGFYTLASAKPSARRNTLPVVVDRTTTLREGDHIALRLLEPARIQGLRLPRGGKLIAHSKIEGNRLLLLIRSIEVGGQITPVKLSAYDLDGQEGVYIPGSEQVSALREMGANIGGSMGTSFTFASSAKDQIVSEAARGVMQGASQLLQKRLRSVKVTLKGGHRLFLVQSK